VLADIGNTYGDIAIALEGAWPEVVGRLDHWQMLLHQLIANAVLYHPKDDQHKKQVSICCDSNNHTVQLTVTDNGLGVSEQMLCAITRPFKRLHTQEDYPGAGMGLSYCDYIAQLNGGVLAFAHADSGGLRVSYSQPLVKTN
jgi:light-regulated signal transduction histidine kinase (bacteriophytochrome)